MTARARVHQPRRALRPILHVVDELVGLLVHAHPPDAVVQVGPIEAALDAPAVLSELEQLLDVLFTVRVRVRVRVRARVRVRVRVRVGLAS